MCGLARTHGNHTDTPCYTWRILLFSNDFGGFEHATLQTAAIGHENLADIRTPYLYICICCHVDSTWSHHMVHKIRRRTCIIHPIPG
jgi:hypothetical protein